MHTSPRPQRSMKLTASAVTQLAAIVRSPSFSRSSSSTTRTISPRRIRLSASSIVASAMVAPLWSSSSVTGCRTQCGAGHDHAAAVRLPPFGVDLASVEVDDPSRDREAEARAAVARGARRVGAVEAFEDPRLLGLGDARAFVDALRCTPWSRVRRARTSTVPPRGVWRTAFSSRFATTWCTRSGSPSAVRSGVSTAIDTSIAGACSRCSRTACSRSGSTRNSVRSSGTVPDSRRERSRSCLTRRPRRSTWREHRVEGLGIGVGDAVDEVLEHGLERGDRRAQLVRHVGDEVAPHAVGLGELGGHPVERPGELTDLVTRRVGAPGGCSRPWPSRRGRRHLAQRRRHAAREEPDHRHRDHGGDDPADRRPQPILMPTQNTKTVTATAAAITKPSLSLIDGMSSSGWASRSRTVHAPGFSGRVPDAVHGAHDVVAELAAQRAHVRVDGARAGAVAVAPHLAEQLLAGEDAAGPFRRGRRAGRTRWA